MKHLTSLFRTLRALIRLARARLQRRERIRREKFAKSLKRSIHIPSRRIEPDDRSWSKRF